MAAKWIVFMIQSVIIIISYLFLVYDETVSARHCFLASSMTMEFISLFFFLCLLARQPVSNILSLSLPQGSHHLSHKNSIKIPRNG